MKSTQEILIEIIHFHVPDCTIFLYGSRARNDHKEGADYDIALDAGAPISPQLLTHITLAIEESTIPNFVDVIDIHQVNKQFLLNIEKDFVLWTQKK